MLNEKGLQEANISMACGETFNESPLANRYQHKVTAMPVSILHG